MIYSVNKGLNPGLYENWKDCEKNVKGYPNAIFKKFKNKRDAEYFLINGKDPPKHKEDKNEIKNNENIEKYQIPLGI